MEQVDLFLQMSVVSKSSDAHRKGTSSILKQGQVTGIFGIAHVSWPWFKEFPVLQWQLFLGFLLGC